MTSPDRCELGPQKEQQSDILSAFYSFMNKNYLLGQVIRWDNNQFIFFEPDIPRTSVVLSIGELNPQQFLVMNYYSRGNESSLKATAIYSTQGMGWIDINFDQTPQYLKIFLGSMFNLPPMEWEEDTHEYIRPPIHKDIVKGRGQDSEGRLLSIEAATIRKDEVSTEYGVDGLSLVALWVTYPEN